MSAPQTPSRWLLNLATGDVVPENVELAKDIPSGKFRRITAAEAQRRLNPPPPAAVEDPQPKDDGNDELSEEEIEDDREPDQAPGADKPKKVDPVIKAQVDDALARAGEYVTAKDKVGLDAFAQEFSIQLDMRRNVHKMYAEFQLKLADTFGITA